MESRPGLMIPQLGADPDAPFPDPGSALPEPDGLLAWGGDLHPRRLLRAYRQGIFPWYSADQPILWWCPARRAVLFPSEVHVSRRLGRLLRQQRFSITADRAFDEVVAGCALPRSKQPTTWITPAMQRAYGRLHQAGHAHSVEVWQAGELAGGIYGIALGGLFFGESMFSAVRDASKVALVSLCRAMARNGYALLDCQIINAHLESMGARELPRAEFLRLLEEQVDRPGPDFASLFPGEVSDLG